MSDCKGCSSSKITRAFAAIKHGALGVAKALVGVDVAPAEAIEARRAICRQCEQAVPCLSNKNERCWCGPVWDGIWGERETCGCSIKYKSMLKDEACPLGKWPAANTPPKQE